MTEGRRFKTIKCISISMVTLPTLLLIAIWVDFVMWSDLASLPNWIFLLILSTILAIPAWSGWRFYKKTSLGSLRSGLSMMLAIPLLVLMCWRVEDSSGIYSQLSFPVAILLGAVLHVRSERLLKDKLKLAGEVCKPHPLIISGALFFIFLAMWTTLSQSFEGHLSELRGMAKVLGMLAPFLLAFVSYKLLRSTLHRMIYGKPELVEQLD
ncbi:hypothetical protein [Persicirhabdus sediminis]|uniref:Uncharacterized protein n=1 Tax=Persicirhabdus sediminis TaxID=454144 RepID=A0A8J7MEX9_9BACT|nr:hypothetical protein [Persicirhabdus sediminis]MBK1792096.1 hypothetical protein [Persicirhabdus sediminis]